MGVTLLVSSWQLPAASKDFPLLRPGLLFPNMRGNAFCAHNLQTARHQTLTLSQSLLIRRHGYMAEIVGSGRLG